MNRNEFSSLTRSIYRSFVASAVLLTIFPLRYPEVLGEAEQRRTIYCYPLVGLVIGVILWLTTYCLPDANLLTAAIVLVIWVILSGALHLDGLADSSDAWLGGLGDREKTLRILRDPLCGAMAVVSVALVLLLKVSALQLILEHGRGSVLIIIALLARATPIYLFWLLPYVRSGGLGTSLAPKPEDLLWMRASLVVMACIILLATGVSGLWLVAVTVFVVWAAAHASRKRLGGFTGDVAGATIELTECALCIAIALSL